MGADSAVRHLFELGCTSTAARCPVSRGMYVSESENAALTSTHESTQGDAAARILGPDHQILLVVREERLRADLAITAVAHPDESSSIQRSNTPRQAPFVAFQAKTSCQTAARTKPPSPTLAGALRGMEARSAQRGSACQPAAYEWS